MAIHIANAFLGEWIKSSAKKSFCACEITLAHEGINKLPVTRLRLMQRRCDGGKQHRTCQTLTATVAAKTDVYFSAMLWPRAKPDLCNGAMLVFNKVKQLRWRC